MEILAVAITISCIVLLIVCIVSIVKTVKKKRSSCPSCKAMYSYPEDFKIIVGPLKWERKTKTEYKGDFKYEVEYRVFYRVVTFDFKCSKCGHTRWFNKKYELYSSDSPYSQSDAEEIALLEEKIRATFSKELLAGKELDLYAAEG